MVEFCKRITKDDLLYLIKNRKSIQAWTLFKEFKIDIHYQSSTRKLKSSDQLEDCLITTSITFSLSEIEINNNLIFNKIYKIQKTFGKRTQVYNSNKVEEEFEEIDLSQEDLKEIFNQAKSQIDYLKIYDLSLQKKKIEKEATFIINSKDFKAITDLTSTYSKPVEIAEEITFTNQADKFCFFLSSSKTPVKIYWSDFDRMYKLEGLIIPSSNSDAINLAFDMVQSNLELLFEAAKLSADNSHKTDFIITQRTFNKNTRVVENKKEYLNWNLDKLFVLEKWIVEKTHSYKAGDDNREFVTNFYTNEIWYDDYLIRDRVLNRLIPPNKKSDTTVDFYYSPLEKDSLNINKNKIDKVLTSIVREYIKTLKSK